MANKFPLGNQFQRLGRFPLDETAFYDNYADALDYAANNPSAYVGQHIFVKDARTEKEKLDTGIKPYSEFYFVTTDYKLEPICCLSRELLVLLTFLLENAEYKSDMSENLETLRYLLNLGMTTVTGPEPPPLGNCKITLYMLPEFNTEGDTVGNYVTLLDADGNESTTATITPLGEVKVTNSNITSLFTETYFKEGRYVDGNGQVQEGEDINLIGRTLKKYLIEDTEGNSVHFEGSSNYLFIEFGPCHFATFKPSHWENSSNNALKRIKIKEGFVVDSIERAFNRYLRAELIEGLKYIDTSTFTSLKEVFQNCKSVKELDVTDWDVTLVEDVQGLFEGCEEVTSVGDLSLWKPYNLRNTARMFSNCNKLTNASIWHFDVSKVTDMNHMFNYCEKLENIDVSSWDVSKVTDMEYMFCHTNNEDIVNQLQNWKPFAVKNLGGFLSGTPIVNADLSIWSNYRDSNYNFVPDDLSYMFNDCTSLESVNLSGWIPNYYPYRVNNNLNMDSMFKGCTNLTDIDMTDWVRIGGSKYRMFNDCASLSEDVIHDFVAKYSNDDAFATTNIAEIFRGCHQVTTLDWSNVTLTQPIEANYMCIEMNNLETFTMKNWRINEELWEQNYRWYRELFNFDRGAWVMNNVAPSGDKLKTVDMSGWHGEAPMSFFHSGVLESVNLSCDELNEGKILWIPESSEMFAYCYKLKEVNLKNVCLGNKLDGMFAWCQELTHINFDGCTLQSAYGYRGSSGGEDMTAITIRNMFYNCLMLQRENISMVGCSDEFVAAVDEAFANRYTEDTSYRGY